VGRGVKKPTFLKESMKLKWNFQRGWRDQTLKASAADTMTQYTYMYVGHKNNMSYLNLGRDLTHQGYPCTYSTVRVFNRNLSRWQNLRSRQRDCIGFQGYAPLENFKIWASENAFPAFWSKK